MDISDTFFLINSLFLGGAVLPCLDAADANGDERIDVADPVYLIQYSFLGGQAPPAPFPQPGPDPPPPAGRGHLGCVSSAYPGTPAPTPDG